MLSLCRNLSMAEIVVCHTHAGARTQFEHDLKLFGARACRRAHGSAHNHETTRKGQEGASASGCTHSHYPPVC